MAATAAAAAVLAAVGTAGAASASTSARTGPDRAMRAIAHSHPAFAKASRQVRVSHSSAKVNGRVYLAPRGGLGALSSAASAIATKGSSSYHHFLTRQQYVARYAPTKATVSAVSKYLSSVGLRPAGVGAENRYIKFSGTVKGANKAFGTQLAQYRFRGHTVQAPATSLKIPASLSASILTITGLDSADNLMKPVYAPPAGFHNARPCSIYYGQIQAKYKADFSTPLPQFFGKTLAYAPCGYTGPQFRAAYEGNSNLDGSGVTVAITDAYASKTLASDANRYAEMNGDGSYAEGQLTETVASQFTHKKLCGPSGWSGEQSLDVEAVHAMAPGANIHFYGAASCEDNDLIDALAQVDQDDTAQLVTNSWGSPAEGETADSVAAFESVFLQGAIQGISFMFSSGDEGDELQNTGIRQADYPTSDPYVTSVGGTSTEIGPNGTITKQTGWGTVKWSLSADGTQWTNPTFLYGSGGGESTLFNRPSYQDGATTSPYRTVPDVSMDADPNTGMLIGLTQKFPKPEGVSYDQYRIGGTSLASPLFAGLTALTIEHGQQAIGLLNPTIYADKADFSDVTPHRNQYGDVRVDYVNGVDASNGLVYSVRTFNQDSSLQTTKGYDEVTGLGTGGPAWITAVESP